jgi:hypothetical protein
MARYFFHIDGLRPYVDESGTILRNDRAAWEEVRRTVHDIEDHMQPSEEWRIEVLRDDKAPVFVVSLHSCRR